MTRSASGQTSTAGVVATGRECAAFRLWVDALPVQGYWTLMQVRNYGFADDLIELARRDLKRAMSLFQSELGVSRLRGREMEGAARNVAYPQRAHELQARQSAELLRVPLA